MIMMGLFLLLCGLDRADAYRCTIFLDADASFYARWGGSGIDVASRKSTAAGKMARAARAAASVIAHATGVEIDVVGSWVESSSQPNLSEAAAEDASAEQLLDRFVSG
jgi:hypothetical protein